MKYYILLLAPLLSSVNSYSQVGIVESQVKANSYVGAEVYQIPVRKGSLVGTPYLEDNWLIGNVFLKKGGSITNTPIKYDIQNQQVLFRETERVMLVKLNYVDSFNILMASGKYLDFIINRSWILEGKDASGVYEKLTSFGKYGLLKKHEVIIIKANYNVALNAGEKDDRFEKEYKLYFLKKENNELTEVPNSRKKVGFFFNDEKVVDYIKKNKIDVKHESGLIELIEYINSNL